MKGTSSFLSVHRKQPVDERREARRGEYLPEHCPEAVCGTVAGDDTIIVVIREGYSREDVITQLSRCVPCNRM